MKSMVASVIPDNCDPEKWSFRISERAYFGANIADPTNPEWSDETTCLSTGDRIVASHKFVERRAFGERGIGIDDEHIEPDRA
jgi:hypothetical protein